MKMLNIPLSKLFLITALLFTSLVSCKKSTDQKIASPLSLEEYINYTVNGTAYSFVMPAASVLADTITENQTFFNGGSVLGNRVPFNNNDFSRISYDRHNIAAGSLQRLTLFAAPQTEVYPYNASTAAPVYIQITAYGNVGEYIAGDFSTTITGQAPGNLQYDVTCSFRVRRRI